MDTIEEAALILRQAEMSLRELLAKTAASGHYDDLMRLGDLAKEVAVLVTRAEDSGSPERRSASSDSLPSTKPLLDVAESRPRGQSGLKKRNSYPKFLRDGETIIKIGWSKTAKADYEHKAPNRILDHLVATLKKLPSTKKRFTMEQVLPLYDPLTGSEIPAYQAYLCLAWLRKVGIITQHGRQGYSLSNREGIDKQVEERWRELATR
jgi:hypothetical protein